MLAANVFAAETDAEGARLRTSMQQAFARLRSGQPGKLPRPVADIDAEIGAPMRSAVDHALRISAVGSPAKVRRELEAMISRWQPDEIIITGQIHDHEARKASFAIAAEILQGLEVMAPA